MQSDGESYKKVYKQLGDQHQNKDLRNAVKAKLDEKPENHISPGMWLTLNPQYRMDEEKQASEAKAQFKGASDEPVDKIYFRRRDEHSRYAESLFMTKQVLTKK